MTCLCIAKPYITLSILILLFKTSSFEKTCLHKQYINCSITENIVDFMRFNFEKFLDRLSIVSFDLDDSKVHKTIHDLMKRMKEIMLGAKNKSFYVNTNDLNTTTRNKSMENFEANVVAIATSTKTSNWQRTFEWMKNTRVNTGMLIIIGEINSEKAQYLDQVVQNMSFNSMFHLMFFKENENRNPIWNQIISVQECGKGIINRISFDSFGRIEENFDMKGLNIRAVALDWEPYFTIPNCKIKDNDCKENTYLGETMNVLGDMMNFTWEAYRQESNNWGTKPISGPANSSGVWGGVIGDVFYGKYQLSIR